MSAPSLVEDVFLAALEKNTPEQRAAFLDAACKDDPDLRRRVERLLEAHPKAGGFLESPARPAGEETAAYAPTGEQVGTVIAGRYKLLEQIGEGGMGTVWVAEQTQPVRRKVALKLIKPGMDSKMVLSRFEAERQALALMDHPNIAKVLDGGTTETGRPFFVMEYVKGIPFTKYCDDTRLSIAERLALFVPVCQAVQHAHQKGVIHRDLKPSNILVCLYDGKPVPKVIDFGLAKAIHQPLTEHTLHTAHGAMMGTPLYMSPEQAEFNNFDVDTRTDIYALGVILYELLTGTTPLEKQRFQEAAWLEMLRLIKEEEPPRPSARLSGSATLPSLAEQRQLEPVKLTKLVRGELDWIVMKCLEKDRSRRYETATGLARDVERYLSDELVEARPPTAGYRLRKFARKHRVAISTAAAFAGLLIAAAAVSSWLAVKAKRSETAAEERRIEAVANAKEAEANAKLAEKERIKAEYNAEEALRIGSLLGTEQTGAMTIAGIQAVGLNIDLGLAELRTDPKVGLLRLARPLKHTYGPLPLIMPGSHGTFYGDFSTNPVFVELREFATMAVLATGQRFAPLLPPITHDGQAVAFASLSPDKQTLLTLGKDYTARLWDARTARPIALLRKGDERVVNCGFSPDGRTVFTDDQSSVARFWDAPSGRFRAATEARPNRYVVSESWLIGGPQNASQISDGRLLTRRFAGKESRGAGSLSIAWEGPVELWDAATGRVVARLDAPGRNVDKFQFLNGGRWITTLEGSSTLLVFSAEDGRLLAQLNHPAEEDVEHVDVGPTGRRLATLTKKSGAMLLSLRVWDTETWRAEPVTTTHTSNNPAVRRLQYWTDDSIGSYVMLIDQDGDGGLMVYRYGQKEPVADFSGGWSDLFERMGERAHSGTGRVYDTRTWERLLPPPGRKFHPDLARFAPDGRFVRAAINGEQALIDTRTDKAFRLRGYWSNLPKFGMIQATTANDEATIRMIPSGSLVDVSAGLLEKVVASHLNLPADLLELWAQVAVRGELGPDGEFVKWDETTWEKKRQELAAKPVPYPDFPFPGHVANDKTHWLRAEFGEAKSDAEKLRIARELLRQAEAAGDRAEVVWWRAEVDRRGLEVAPVPREVKP